MTTTQLVTYFLKLSKNTVTRTEMLEFIDQAQNEILGIDCAMTKSKPDPNLATTSGTYTYTLSAGVRRVGRVYVKGQTNYQYGTPWKPNKQYKDLGRNAEGDLIFEVPVHTVESKNPTSADCQVIFPSDDNPGTTTTTFFLEQYNWPTQLTSESVAVDIPAQHQTGVLMANVMRRIELLEFGNSNYWDARYEKEWNKWLAYCNDSKTATRSDITYRSI